MPLLDKITLVYSENVSLHDHNAGCGVQNSVYRTHFNVELRISLPMLEIFVQSYYTSSLLHRSFLIIQTVDKIEIS